MASGIVTRHLIEQGEWQLRLDWHNIIQAQREAFPIRETIKNRGVPATIITDWQNEFSNWFLNRREFWRKVWDRAINSGGIKLTTQEAYDEWIEDRAGTAGLELAAVNAKTIGEVFRLHSAGSVQNLTRALKESIGLNPGQFSAFVDQSASLRKAYSPERAKVLTDRLYQKKINYRAQLIARNEMSEGVNQAQVSDIQGRITRGELPQRMEKRWSTVGDDRVSAKCQDNENDGWIPFEDEFTSGHSRPPRFPGCRCGIQFRKAR